MEVSLYQAAAAMNATEQWQELISENLAGASTPGARKHEISFSAVQAGLTPPSSAPTRPGFVIPMATATTNFQQGELHSTGDPMDPGFSPCKAPPARPPTPAMANFKSTPRASSSPPVAIWCWATTVPFN